MLEKVCIKCNKSLSIRLFRRKEWKFYDTRDYNKSCKSCIKESHKVKVHRPTHKKYYAPWWFLCKERDGNKCVDCGSDETKSNLLVHHIDESRKTGKLNNNLDNLVTLCKPCHARRHGMTIVAAREDIKKMRSSGMTFEGIGEKMGLSRQRIHQIMKKISLLTSVNEGL